MSNESSSNTPVSINNNQNDSNLVTSKCGYCKNLTVKIENQRVILKFNFLCHNFFLNLNFR